MDETDMSKKILGSQTDNEPEEKKTANWLADNVIWYVSKKGCGTSVFRGPMAEALMNGEDKKRPKTALSVLKA